MMLLYNKGGYIVQAVWENPYGLYAFITDEREEP